MGGGEGWGRVWLGACFGAHTTQGTLSTTSHCTTGVDSTPREISGREKPLSNKPLLIQKQTSSPPLAWRRHGELGMQNQRNQQDHIFSSPKGFKPGNGTKSSLRFSLSGQGQAEHIQHSHGDQEKAQAKSKRDFNTGSWEMGLEGFYKPRDGKFTCCTIKVWKVKRKPSLLSPSSPPAFLSARWVTCFGTSRTS